MSFDQVCNGRRQILCIHYWFWFSFLNKFKGTKFTCVIFKQKLCYRSERVLKCYWIKKQIKPFHIHPLFSCSWFYEARAWQACSWALSCRPYLQLTNSRLLRRGLKPWKEIKISKSGPRWHVWNKDLIWLILISCQTH